MKQFVQWITPRHCEMCSFTSRVIILSALRDAHVMEMRLATHDLPVEANTMGETIWNSLTLYL